MIHPNSGRGAETSARGAVHQERAAHTRAQVLLSASELFAERGFAGTSMQDVAQQASVTKGAVYFHFPTKERLAVAVVDEHYARWPGILDDLAAHREDPLDTALRMLDRAAVEFRDNPVIQAGARLQNEWTAVHADLPTPYVGWTDMLQALFADAAERGELRPGVDPAKAARLAVSTFFGLQHISYRLNNREDILERWAEARELLLYSFRAVAPGGAGTGARPDSRA